MTNGFVWYYQTDGGSMDYHPLDVQMENMLEKRRWGKSCVQLYICYEKEIVLRKLWISDGLTGELTEGRYLHIQLLL